MKIGSINLKGKQMHLQKILKQAFKNMYKYFFTDYIQISF